MSLHAIQSVVDRLAEATLDFSDALLGNETYGWDAYAGIRYVHLHTYLTLRSLAVEVAQARLRAGRPQSEAQAILAQHRATFRRFTALYLGLSDEDAATPPAPREWPARMPILHVLDAEQAFLASILLGVRAHRAGEAVDPTQLDALYFSLGDPEEVEDAPLTELLAAYGRLHNRVLTDLADLRDDELTLTTPFWEPEWLDIRFRLHRFHTHVAEHSNQVEKTLIGIGKAPTEAKRLLIQVYSALGELEGALIGAEGLLAERIQAAADDLSARIHGMLAGAEQVRQMVAAVKAGDLATVQALLAANPATASASDDQDIFVVMTALYYGHKEIAQALVDAGAYLDIFAAASLGKTERVIEILGHRASELNAFSRDGYPPLGLACFFGHEETARHLLDAGADIHAVSRNPMRVQPIHAAVAANSTPIVRLLIQRGADVNAVQQDNFTPLMGARQNGNQEMIDLLIGAGAVG